MAFHVDYWDRLGWKDPFGSAAHSARQAQQLAINGAGFSYTPQVVIDGIDAPDWRGTRLATRSTTQAAASAALQVQLQREGDRYVAVVEPGTGAPHALAAFWAVTEHQHASNVLAGENQGARLTHDFVVTDYRAVSAWNAVPGAHATFNFSPATASSAAHPRQVNLVITDATSGRPVQAIKLGC